MSRCDMALAVSDSGGGVVRECHAGGSRLSRGWRPVRLPAPALLELDGDPVVDALEHQGAEGHRDGGSDHEVDHVRETRQMA